IVAVGLALCVGCSPPPRAAGDAPTGDDASADAPSDTAVLIDASPDGPPATGGDPFEALATIQPKCRNNWCWWKPRPWGGGFSVLADTGPNNIWIAGGYTSASIVMQWNGNAWVIHEPALPPGETEEGFPWAIDGSGPNNVWMIYGYTVQQWDGHQWT